MGEATKQTAEVINNLRSVVFKESESLEGTCAKINGYDFNQGLNYSQLLKSLASTGFQASNLGDAIETVNQMVSISIPTCSIQQILIKFVALLLIAVRMEAFS